MNAKCFTLFCIGANHNGAELSLREGLYLNSEQISIAIPLLIKKYEISELIVLSTCNRIELIGAAHYTNKDQRDYFEIFIDLQRFGKQEDVTDVSKIENSTYFLYDDDVVAHLFAVAAGMDSMVLGETQITGQFKEATRTAELLHSLGPILGRLSQEALATAKKIRSFTAIGRKPTSIAHVAIDLANRVYGPMKDHCVTIIGAGQMAKIAAQNTLKYAPKQLTILNRTKAHGEALVLNIGRGEAKDLAGLENAIIESDVIISATSAGSFIIPSGWLADLLPKRKSKPLFIVDLALPRNIDPEIEQFENVYLFDIDDLKLIANENLKERQIAAKMASDIVRKNTESFMAWLTTMELRGALSGFKSYLEELFFKETNKTLSKEMYKNLTQIQRDGIESLIRSLSGKISQDASKTICSSPDGYYRGQLADALKALFRNPRE